MAIQLQGSNAVALYGETASNSQRVTLYDSAGNPLVVAPNSAVGATQKVLPAGGVAEGNWTAARLDRMGNMRPGNDLLWLRDPIEGATVNNGIWISSIGGSFGQVQTAAAGISLNSPAIASANSYSTLTSYKQLPLSPQAPLRARMRARVIPQTNAVTEIGFGAPVTNTAQLANGAYWRWTTAGTLVPVLSFNGSDVAQGTDVSGLLSSANYYMYEVTVTESVATFAIYNGLLLVNQQTLAVAASQPDIWSVTHLPVFIRLYSTSTAPPAAPMALLSEMQAQSFDLMTNKPWGHQLAGAGQGGEILPAAGGQAANWPNSAAPATAALSNTAAGYATLGGLFVFGGPAGSTADYLLFSAPVPAPYSFYCTGVHVSAFNNGAAVATTPTTLQWGLQVNGLIASLASNINPTTRLPLGSMYFQVGAGVGQGADKDLDLVFDPPLRTDPGRYLGAIVRIPVGTATASQVIQGSVLIRGYFE